MEKKNSNDFIPDGVLDWGVSIGRFVFEQDKVIVYAVSNITHLRVDSSMSG